MLKTVIKHYLIDIGLTTMFDNMVLNFTVSENFFDTYKNLKNKEVFVLLTQKCIHDRNLETDVVSGKLVDILDDSLKIELGSLSVELLGWHGNIYLYREDIYKLYS